MEAEPRTWRELARLAGQPVTPAEQKENIQMFAQMLKAPGLKMSFVAPAQLAYRLVAQNKVVEVTGPGGKAPITGKQKDSTLSMEIYAAKIDGRWVLVR